MVRVEAWTRYSVREKVQRTRAVQSGKLQHRALSSLKLGALVEDGGPIKGTEGQEETRMSITKGKRGLPAEGCVQECRTLLASRARLNGASCGIIVLYRVEATGNLREPFLWHGR